MKNIFLPSEQNPSYLSNKLNYDAQRACEKAAIRVDDLLEKTKEDFYIYHQNPKDLNI